MILAPPEKINLHFEFYFYFLSLPFKVGAKILHFYMVQFVKNHFI